MFNNYYRLKDLFAPTKTWTKRDNTKFETTQVLDILFQNWFSINSTLVLLDSKDEEETTYRPL